MMKDCLWIRLPLNVVVSRNPHDMTWIAAGDISVKISKQIAGVGFSHLGLRWIKKIQLMDHVI